MNNALTGIIAASGRKATGGIVTDPQFANVVLLLNFDQSLADQSHYSHAVTVHGNAALSSTQHLVGSQSLRLDGSGSYLTVADAPEFGLAASDWTFEIAAQVDNLTQYDAFVTKRATDASFRYMSLFFDDPTNQLHATATTGNSSWTGALNDSGAMAATTWYHMALSRVGNNLYLHKGTGGAGAALTMVGSVAFTGSISVDSSPLYIGCAGADVGAPMKGYIQASRFTVGAARFGTGNSTIPALPYPTS